MPLIKQMTLFDANCIIVTQYDILQLCNTINRNKQDVSIQAAVLLTFNNSVSHCPLHLEELHWQHP